MASRRGGSKREEKVALSPKPEAVALANGVPYVVERVLPFYSHTRRSAAEVAEDQALHIDRRVFSNLYPAPVDIGAAAAARFGLVRSQWPSSEHAFQAAKCALPADQHFIATLSTNDAARYGQGRLQLSAEQRAQLVELGVPEAELVRCSGTGAETHWKRSASGYVPLVAGWDQTKKAVMLTVLRAKFAGVCAAAVESMAALVSSGINVFLVEHTANDRQWADAGDGSGCNMLGKLLTLLVLEKRGGSAVGAEPLDAEFLARPNRAFVTYN